MKICCFAGHRDIYEHTNDLEVKVKKEIINLIENQGVNIFYNGNNGAFDGMCRKIVYKLKKEYPFIKSYWVLSYMPKESDVNLNYFSKFFDGTIYPDIEKVPLKFAIIKRNEWMVNNSNFLISYVNHDCGGAHRTFQYAKGKRLKIIDVPQAY